MPSIDDVFGGKGLKSDDITGREPTVTISRIEAQDFKDRSGASKKKLVVHFRGAQKVLICNRTNANRIAAMYGKDYTQWIGKQITLFVDPFVEFGGEITPAIRVKLPTAPAQYPQEHIIQAVQPRPANQITSGARLQEAAAQETRQRESENPVPFDDDVPF